jgi:hypothetical protein
MPIGKRDVAGKLRADNFGPEFRVNYRKHKKLPLNTS